MELWLGLLDRKNIFNSVNITLFGFLCNDKSYYKRSIIINCHVDLGCITIYEIVAFGEKTIKKVRKK